MSDYRDINNLNPTPTALITGADKVPFYNTSDSRPYAMTMDQLQTWVLAGGTIDPTFDDVSADTVTITGTTGNTLVVDTNTLVVDASTNRVGIGTTSPSDTLHVTGQIRIAASDASLLFDSVTKDWLFQTVDADGRLRFRNNTDAVDVLVLSAAGNAGLGVTPSAWGVSGAKALEVGNAGTSIFGVSAANVWFTSNFYYSDPSTARYSSSNFASAYQQFSGTHRWYTAPSGTAGNAISFTQAMMLDASGNLGIGIASPLGRLHVSAADAFRIGLIAGATRAVRIGADSTAAYVEGVDQTGAASYQPLFVGGSTVNLHSNGAEKLRVDSTTTAGQTALLLWDVDNGTLERVTVGAADSGGTGFKVLRIPN